MPKGVMVVRTAPSTHEREEEFNHWYGKTHLPEILAIPAITAARRYRLLGEGDAPYLAIYEIEADDIADVLTQLRGRALEVSDALRMDPPPELALWELIE